MAPALTPESPHRRVLRSRVSATGRLVGAAAALVGAFATGWVAHGSPQWKQPTLVAAPSIEMRSAHPPSAPIVHTAAPEAESFRPHARPVEYVVGPDFDPRWLSGPPAPLPERVRRQLERRGYEVEQRRALMSMDLDENARLSVPVDEVELRFVGQRTY